MSSLKTCHTATFLPPAVDVPYIFLSCWRQHSHVLSLFITAFSALVWRLTVRKEFRVILSNLHGGALLMQHNLAVTVLPQKQIYCKIECPINCKKKHCQRRNLPEGWVHITSSYINIDQISISESLLSINFKISISIESKVKILTKPSFIILTKTQFRNLNQISAAKYWPNFNFKLLTKPCIENLKKVKLYDQT